MSVDGKMASRVEKNGAATKKDILHRQRQSVGYGSSILNLEIKSKRKLVNLFQMRSDIFFSVTIQISLSKPNN